MSLKATIAELILNATAAGRAMLTAADAAAQKVLLSLGNVNNTSDAEKPVSTATAAALSGKQATLVSGTNIKTINSTSLLGSGDIVISAGIGGSTGATDNRLLRSDGTGGSTAQASNATLDDTGNLTINAGLVAGSGSLAVTTAFDVLVWQGGKLGFANAAVGVGSSADSYFVRNSAGSIGVKASGGTDGTFTAGAITASGTANAGSQVLRVQGSGSGFTRLNDNGTVIIDADVSSGSTPLSVRYNGTEQWGISFSGILSGRSGCTLNIGAGQMHLTHSSSLAQVKTFGNLALLPGNLGGGGTSVDVTGSLTASALMCAGAYTVATLPSASANAGKFAQVTDSSVTTFGSTVAGSGSNRVPVFSNGTNWVVA